MGREIKRVPLDFDWPLNMIWKGFVNPYSGAKCSACNGSGYSPEYRALKEEWYGINYSNGWCRNLDQDDVQALIDAGRLWDFTRTPRNEEHRGIIKKKIEVGGNSWLPFNNGYVPTAEEVNVWATKGIGHDSINASVCVDAKAKRLGYAESTCKYCKGKGSIWPDDKYIALQEEFKFIDPPKGEGWQMWENVSEGSPISPAMETPELLARWLVANNASAFGGEGATYDQWINMINAGFALSFALSMIGGSMGLRSGVAATPAK